MNERIKLLKHQASVWCDENIPEQFSEEINGYGKAWEDKFAELIVRECIKEIYSVTIDNSTDDWDQGYNSGLNSAAETIKTHFGVEE